LTDGASARERRAGLLAGGAAYGLWGLFPIYFKALASVPPLEILAHRVTWALLLLLLLVRSREQTGPLKQALRGKRLALLAASGLMIALNWLVYLWSISTDRILEASLGYFITPLVSVLLGVVVLREPLERTLLIATGLAGFGVAWMTLELGRLPWIALALALLFGCYGMLRKIVSVGAVVGLSVETLLLLPFALGYMLWARADGRLAFLSGSVWRDVLLVLGGPLTALPLLLFVGAARRLPLSTLAFLQYLSPSISFLLAVFLYREPLTLGRLWAFLCIWSGVALLLARQLRETLRPLPPE
jgi:chloramphenicol-sensitive protein RarD